MNLFISRAIALGLSCISMLMLYTTYVGFHDIKSAQIINIEAATVSCRRKEMVIEHNGKSYRTTKPIAHYLCEPLLGKKVEGQIQSVQGNITYLSIGGELLVSEENGQSTYKRHMVIGLIYWLAGALGAIVYSECAMHPSGRWHKHLPRAYQSK